MRKKIYYVETSYVHNGNEDYDGIIGYFSTSKKANKVAKGLLGEDCEMRKLNNGKIEYYKGSYRARMGIIILDEEC